MAEKKELAYYQARPDEYSVESNGAIRRRADGQIVTIFPELNPYAITTPERGRELARMRRAYGLRSKLLGMIDAYNEKQENPADRIDPDALTDEEVIAAGGDALRLLTKHMTLKFVESGNLRGMGEVFTKLAEPFAEDPHARETPPPAGTINATPAALVELLHALESEKAAALDRARAIDVQAYEALGVKPSEAL